MKGTQGFQRDRAPQDQQWQGDTWSWTKDGREETGREKRMKSRLYGKDGNKVAQVCNQVAEKKNKPRDQEGPQA